MEYYARVMVCVFGWGLLVVKFGSVFAQLTHRSENSDLHASVIFYIYFIADV